MSNIPVFPETGFLRIKQLLNFIPASEPTIWRWVKNGQFPKPVKLGPRTTAFDVAAVREWMEERNREPKDGEAA